MTIEVKNSIKLVDYTDSMQILEDRVHSVLLGEKKELLWILEHKTVFTAGSSSNEEDIINKTIQVVKTNRGGKHTLHLPGQKIAYFVLDLNKRGKNIKKLITNIENCIIGILKEYNIESFKDSENIGIWTNYKSKKVKIAAIGIRVKKWIAYHGFALNVSNDLSKYKAIIPCGIKDKGMTSLKVLGVNNYKNINEVIIKKFLDTFR